MKKSRYSEEQIIGFLKEASAGMPIKELRRNRGQRGYRPKPAHEFSQARMRACENGPRIADETWVFVDEQLGALWSPDWKSAACPRSATRASIAASMPTSVVAARYNRALRCQKARRKCYGSRERRGCIPNQVSIDLRPAIVDTLERFGDWEADLVIGAGQQQALVTLNERQSRYALIAHVPFKTAQGSLGCDDLFAEAFR